MMLLIVHIFPSDMSFQTFLLDKDNRVIAIGNPPKAIGATCVQVEDREADCLYSSCWDKC